MTGDRREKALSVFLSTIMVLSVVAMGMAAGFTGSAAAVNNPSENNPDLFADGNATISANPAESGVDDTQQVLLINATDDLTITDSDTITISYENSSNDVSTDTETLAVNDLDSSPGIVSISHIDSDGDLTRLDDDAGGSVGVGTNNVAGDVTFTFSTDQNNIDQTINAGETLRVVLGDGTGGIDIGAGAANTQRVSISSSLDTGEISETTTLSLNEDAPIEVSSTASGATYFSSLQSASDDLNEQGGYLNISGDVNEFANQPTPLGSSASEDGFSLSANIADAGDAELGDGSTGQVDIGNQDTLVTAEGDVSATFVTVDDGESDSVDSGITTGVSGVTIEDLDLVSSDVLGSNVLKAVDTGNDGLTIQNLGINRFAESSADTGVINAGNVADLTVSNVVTDDGASGSDYNAVVVGTAGGDVAVDQLTANNLSSGVGVKVVNSDDADLLVNVTQSTAEIEDGTGFDVTLNPSQAQEQQANLSELTVESDSDGGTGIALSGTSQTGVDADLEGGSIDNVTVGVDASGFSGDFLNVTSVPVTNLDNTGNNQGFVVTDGDVGTVDLDDIEVQGDGSDTTGVDGSDGGAIKLTVQNSLINATDTGIDLTGTGSYDIANAIISGTTIDNSDSRAVNIKPGTNDNAVSINENTSIDQSAGHGIVIDPTSASPAIVEIDDVEINGTANDAIRVTDIDNDADTVNVTSSTLSSSGTGINFNDISTADPEVYVNFNDIVENTDGVTANDQASQFTGDITLTFNDIVGNNNNGLDTSAGINTGTIDAKYSYWGSDAGPNSAGGDSVSLSSSDDATTEPFLLESAVDNYEDSNLGGTNVLRFGHNVEVTNNKGSLAFPAVANRTAGEAIEGDTTNVMIYKLVDGQFVDAGDQVPQTMEGHVVDLTEATNDSAFVTITYSDDVADSAGGYTYEQGANLVGAPIQGPAGDDAVFNLKDDYVISPYLSNTENSLVGSYSGTSSIADDGNSLGQSGDEVSPFSAYVIEVPSNETRFKGGNIPGGTDASEIDALLLGI